MIYTSCSWNAGLQLLSPTAASLVSFFRTNSSMPSTASLSARLSRKEGTCPHVVHFGHQQVFEGATTYTCLLFLDKPGTPECRFCKVDDLDAWRQSGKGIEGTIPAGKSLSAEWNFTVGASSGLCNKLGLMPVKLGDAADIFVGLQTSADDVYIMDLVQETAESFA